MRRAFRRRCAFLGPLSGVSWRRPVFHIVFDILHLPHRRTPNRRPLARRTARPKCREYPGRDPSSMSTSFTISWRHAAEAATVIVWTRRRTVVDSGLSPGASMSPATRRRALRAVRKQAARAIGKIAPRRFGHDSWCRLGTSMLGSPGRVTPSASSSEAALMIARNSSTSSGCRVVKYRSIRALPNRRLR